MPNKKGWTGATPPTAPHTPTRLASSRLSFINHNPQPRPTVAALWSPPAAPDAAGAAAVADHARYLDLFDATPPLTGLKAAAAGEFAGVLCCCVYCRPTLHQRIHPYHPPKNANASTTTTTKTKPKTKKTGSIGACPDLPAAAGGTCGRLAYYGNACAVRTLYIIIIIT